MTPDALPEWIWSHYRTGRGADPLLLCIRCGKEVDWLTKHAVERHHDTDIQVMPPVRPEPPEGWKW
jgi:hypothetical protein